MTLLLLTELDSGEVLDKVEAVGDEVVYESGHAQPIVEGQARRLGVSDVQALSGLRDWTNGYVGLAASLPVAQLTGLLAAHVEPDADVAAALATLRVLRERLTGVRLRELDDIIAELMALTFEPAKALLVRNHPGHADQKSHGRRRTGALGSVLERLEKLADKLSGEDRAELDRAMDQLRGLESYEVNDDLIEEDDEEDDSGDLVMDAASGELTFTPYNDGDVDVDWADGGIRFTPQSGREVVDAVAQFAALPVAESSPEIPDPPESVTTREEYGQWAKQWYEEWDESDAGRAYSAVTEMTTSDGELKIKRYGSGVTQIGDPESVDADAMGLLHLDDSGEAVRFVELLESALQISTGSLQASTPVRFFGPDVGGSLFVRARLTRQRLDEVSAKFDPLQKRDGEGQWASGAVDRLKLAERIELDAGESFVASDVFKVGDGSIMPMALTRTPNGPRLRMGVQIDADDQKSWSARDLGATVSLDQAGIAKLRSTVDEMHTKGDEGGRRFAAIEDRAEDLDQQRRDILKRQYPSLSKADGKRLDRLDRQIEELDDKIENEQSGLRRSRQYLAENDPAAGVRWDEISAEISTLDPDDDAVEIYDLQVEQARLVPSYPLRRMREIPRMQEEREDLELERQELTADAGPLSVEDQSDLATVNADIASTEAERKQMVDTELVEGVIATEWADLLYEVTTKEMTREYENLGIGYRMAARPKDAPADWVPSDTDSWVEFEPADLTKLGRTLDGLLPAVDNAVLLLPSSVTSARVTSRAPKTSMPFGVVKESADAL